jgi:ABC-2 type transport system ATP-binding protein
MDNDIVVSVKNVSKSFKLPHERVDSVKSLFVNPFDKNRRKFENQHALKDINFEIKKGEFFGIVGRNGSGKSTLLKIIARIYEPNKGSVNIKGRLVPFIELGVGFNPELTGRENVFLNGALMGFSRIEITAKYEAIVEFAEIERFMDQKLKNYSSGMQVRLAFSVATILAESDILLIDEVLAVGDADFQRKCFRYFKALKKQGKTVIFVSHDMNAIREYCDRVALIDESVVVTIGTANKVAREYDKLFVNPEEKSKSSVEKGNRWGNTDVTYTSLKISPSLIIDTEDLVITAKVKVNKDVQDAMFGFAIKNGADILMFGNNSKNEQMKFENLKKGETIELQWKIPGILGDGEYFVNVSAESTDSVGYDWWDEASKFSVTRGTTAGMVVYPTMKLSAIREKKAE